MIGRLRRAKRARIVRMAENSRKDEGMDGCTGETSGIPTLIQLSMNTSADGEFIILLPVD